MIPSRIDETAAWPQLTTRARARRRLSLSRSGYTFHESIDAATLNHMNGRVQDPLTGRFLSADPFIPDVEDTQSWNRYSYVNDNPLSDVDPSGFFFKKLFKKVVRWLKKKLIAVISAVAGAIGYALGGGPANPAAVACAVAASAAVGYAAHRTATVEFEFGGAPATGSARGPPRGPTDWSGQPSRRGGGGLPDFGGGTSRGFSPGWTPGAQAAVDELHRSGRIPSSGALLNYSLCQGDPRCMTQSTIGAGLSLFPLGAALRLLGVGRVSVAARAGATIFRTTHYASRLDAAGVDVSRAEWAIAREVAAMRPNMATGADVAGRIRVDNVLFEYRARLLPDGSVNVGTIFPVRP